MQQDDRIDLGAVLGALIDHRWLIILTTGAFLLISAAYELLATPIYQASVLVQVEQKVPNLAGLAAIGQTPGVSSSAAITEIALITSRAVVGQAVDKLGLNVVVTAHRFPLVGGCIARHYSPPAPGAVAAPWLGISRDGWGGEQLDIARLDVPKSRLGKALTLIVGQHGSYELLDDDGEILLRSQIGELATDHGVTLQVKTMRANPGMRFDVVRNSELATVRLFQQGVTTSELGKDSGIILLTYKNANPQLATRLLDQVANAYVRQNVERNSTQAASSLQFVKQQLPLVREKLEKATSALNAYQLHAHPVDITMQTKDLLDQVVAVETGIQQLQLQMQQADIARRLTFDHPAYKALLEKLGRLQQRKAVLEKLGRLQQRKALLEKQIGGLPEAQQELLRLTRDLQVSNETYTGLLKRVRQLEITRTDPGGNVRVIDAATVDTTQPVKRKRAVTVLGGAFLGGFLAVTFILLRQMLSRGVKDPAAIEQLGLAVYASIPLSPQRSGLLRRNHRRVSSGQHLLAVTAPADLAVEALRSLRTSLHFARLQANNNLVMISSASRKAGNTFISSNLGAVIAQAGQKVLLIDADMRKGSQHQVFGGAPEQGLSELISGQIELTAALRPVEGVDGLHLITRGEVPSDPSALLRHANFTVLLQKLAPLYDLVIIDTPPILAVTDAAVIGHHAGTSLLVVRFGVNQAPEILRVKQRFEQNGIKLNGVIFNAIERRSAGYYSCRYDDCKPPK